jgi:hypothetical protein
MTQALRCGASHMQAMLKTAFVFSGALLLAMPLHANPLQELRDTLARWTGNLLLRGVVKTLTDQGFVPPALAGLAAPGT